MTPAGAKGPKLVTRDMRGIMKKGAVLVDVAIDPGGCFETATPTTRENPICVVDGSMHDCGANMPGAVPKTSTMALTSATRPCAVEIANRDWIKVMPANPEIKLGANHIQGKVTCGEVANALGFEYTPIDMPL